MGVRDVGRDQVLPAADSGVTSLHSTVHSGQIVPDEEVTVRGAVFRHLQVLGGQFGLHFILRVEGQ